MLTERQLIIEKERLSELYLLIETYETIAANSMRRIRYFVLSNRAFHEGLNRLFLEVKLAYHEKQRRLLKEKGFGRSASFSAIPRNGKTVYVFLSANTGLYGDIIARAFDLFYQNREGSMAEVVIIGKIGKFLFESHFPGAPYTYFDFPDTHILPEDLKKIINHLSQYETVVAFHGSFKSFFTQVPKSTNVSGEILLQETGDKPNRYLFEPTLEKVAFFFETEIFASLLEQVFYESRLAKLASRLTLLDRASLRIKDASEKTSQTFQLFVHRSFNRKQINALLGISLWFSK